mmetsp:Transcript_35561/g.70016  ORF Transcript_35561/g.70016 Transcript_35561/m.70016 type:complete len:153 (+) Transcript_35561:153-611(+)
MDDLESANQRHAAICSLLDTMKSASLKASTKTSHNNKKQRTKESDSNLHKSDDCEEINEPPSDTEEHCSPHPCNETKRKIANRKYAKASYVRKKRLVENLKSSVASLQVKNISLKEEQVKIKSRIKYLKEKMNKEGSPSLLNILNSPKYHEI